MSSFLIHVGKKIRLFRNTQGLTQEELAEKAGLQYSYIGGVERGERNISLETLKKITDGLNISAYELFQIDELDISTLPDKKKEIEAINNLLIMRNEKEISMIYKLAKNIIDIIDEK